MSKIFDKLEENISKNKDEEKRKEDKRNKLWNKYYAEEKKIQKELKINEDLSNLEKFVKKHIKNTDRTVRCSKNSLEVESTVSLPDGYSTTSVKIEFRNGKELSYYAKDHQIENYKHSKDIYIVHVKLLGDPDIDYVVTENIREDKIFKINEKDSAYEYFNHLFQKNILYLDVKI
jgi:hypothetical protein